MIKINNFIFNENEIVYIEEYDAESLGIMFKGKDKCFFVDAHTEDIEWNYGSPQETQRKIQKDLCKSCYYRDTISNKLKELEEKNKTFEDCNKDLNNQLDKLEEDLEAEKSTSSNLAKRILKAIKYLELNVDIPKNHLEEVIKDREEDLLKILKGEE